MSAPPTTSTPDTPAPDQPPRSPALEYDFADPTQRNSLHDRLTDIRSETPVGWSDLYGGFWLLSSYEDVQDAARDHERFTTREGIMIPPTGASMRVIPAELDPPEHTPYRKLTLPYFTARAVAQMEPEIRAIVRRIIAGFSRDGRADLVDQLSEPVPPLVIGLAVGLDESEWPVIRKLANDFLSSARVGIEAKMKAAATLEEWIWEQIASRRAEPRDDTLSKLVNAKIDGEPMPDHIALGMIQLMVVAGHETTVHGIASMLYRVLAEPGLVDRLRTDPELRRRAVQESLRLDPPIMHMARTAVGEQELHGSVLRGGDKVMLNFGAANRDPQRFPDPHRFDVERDARSHLAFGTGRHRCIGEHLAVTEMLVVLEEILSLLPDTRRVGPADAPVDWRGGSNTLGPVSLEVEFTPVTVEV